MLNRLWDGNHGPLRKLTKGFLSLGNALVWKFFMKTRNLFSHGGKSKVMMLPGERFYEGTQFQDGALLLYLAEQRGTTIP